MAFQLSPGVNVVEKDFTAIVPAVSTTAGGFAGTFQWGPVEELITVDSENTLVRIFGEPTDTTFASFFTAANFLSYANNLQVARVVGPLARNAVESGTAILIKNEDDYTLNYSSGQGNVGSWASKYPGVLGNAISVELVDSFGFATYVNRNVFDAAPLTSEYASNLNGSNDEVHVLVIDRTGAMSGTPGTILEKYQFLSKASDAKKADGSTNFYKDVINGSSKFIYWMDHPIGTTNWGTTALNKTFNSLTGVLIANLSGGVSDDVLTDQNAAAGYALFADSELVDVSLIPLGAASGVVATQVIGILETRKDAMAFISPPLNTVVNNINDEAADIISFRNTLPSTSYAVMDTGYKVQYDRYNDKLRLVPLNGDIAGLCARTDSTNDAWFSPAGFTRGQIKNVVKLAYSPNQTERDLLYKAGVNPVISKPGQGTVLFGDKTLLSRPSAFDRINVRRLFIVLEKAIATAAKFQLFELNDTFTRAQFKNLVEPFLRDVQGRRGIVDFRVKCDETNNTGEVIDRNEFVADIFIKPARSINFITLNFIAARSSANFEEIGG